MTARENFGRRLHDFNPAQAAVEILRVCPLTPEDFQAVVNALVLRADEFYRDGWFGMGCVADSLGDATSHLEDVRGPGHERRDAEDEQHQRELRQWAFERSL
jgi:hypothetical protein